MNSTDIMSALKREGQMPMRHTPANNKNKPAHTIRQQNVYCIAVLVILCIHHHNCILVKLTKTQIACHDMHYELHGSILAFYWFHFGLLMPEKVSKNGKIY